jgi:hypothetical protein
MECRLAKLTPGIRAHRELWLAVGFGGVAAANIRGTFSAYELQFF